MYAWNSGPLNVTGIVLSVVAIGRELSFQIGL